MPFQRIDKFKGLLTEADIFSTDGTNDTENCSITINNDIEKSKGILRVDYLKLAFTGVSKATEAVITLNEGWTPTTLLETNNFIMVTSVSDTEFQTILSGKIWHMKSVDLVAHTITLEDCDTSGVVSTTTPTGYIDASISSIIQGSPGFPITFPYVFGHFSLVSGSPSTTFKSLGSFYDGTYLLNFIYDVTLDKSYLLYTLTTEINWQFVEGYSAPTDWGSGIGKFIKHEDIVLFVKNETKEIDSSSGGVFWIDGTYGSATIKLFGNVNNPTGKHIKKHKERIWIGNISKISDTAIDGKSWCMLSKIFPEIADTKVKIVSATVGARTTLTLATGHGFNVGDNVYLEGGAGTAGIEILNGTYVYVTETNTTQIVVDVDTTGATYTGNDGYVSLRGYNWSPSYNKFNAGVSGAGILFFDNNSKDEVFSLETNFGQMVIFREDTIYFYTGEISTGDVSLARRLNVPYGAVSENIAISAGGTWFVSRYGISKVEGVGVKTTVTELDNILSITYSENIKTDFDNISDKSAIILHYVDRFLWVHDPNADKTWTFDTLNGNWMLKTEQLVQSYFFNIDNKPYAVYGVYVFNFDQGYQTYSATKDTYEAVSSFYKLPLLDQADPYHLKDYTLLYMLAEGIVTTEDNAYLYIDVYLNGNFDAIYNTYTFDLKVDNAGDMVESHRYTVGTANNLTLMIRHNDVYKFKISRIGFFFDALYVEDFTAEAQ